MIRPDKQLAFPVQDSAPDAIAGGLGPVRPREASRTQVAGTKRSIFYRAHSYHTKVPPEGVPTLLEHFIDRGDVVADPFCGSGMTGVAALPTGRTSVLSHLSPAAAHIASNFTRRVEPEESA